MRKREPLEILRGLGMFLVLWAVALMAVRLHLLFPRSVIVWLSQSQNPQQALIAKGGERIIQGVISTYGSPKLDSYVMNIRDDHFDNLPRDLHECSSIERVSPTGGDIFDNWREIGGGSPGEAPY